MSFLRRPAASEYDARYNRYLDLVPEENPLQAMSDQLDETSRLVLSISKDNLDTPCAAGEWTAREIFGHIVDTERIFGYRILCYGRGDSIPLDRADQESYVKAAEFGRYPFEELLQEYTLVRQSHILFLQHLSPEAWERAGMVAGLSISVRALAYLMVGHERHHLATIETLYM